MARIIAQVAEAAQSLPEWVQMVVAVLIVVVTVVAFGFRIDSNQKLLEARIDGALRLIRQRLRNIETKAGIPQNHTEEDESPMMR